MVVGSSLGPPPAIGVLSLIIKDIYLKKDSNKRKKVLGWMNYHEESYFRLRKKLIQIKNRVQATDIEGFVTTGLIEVFVKTTAEFTKRNVYSTVIATKNQEVYFLSSKSAP
jgi:hypothetical protein